MRLLRKLESITTLSEEARQAVLKLPMSVRDIPADQDILREGDRPGQCCLLVEGFLCRYKMLPDGKRQILSLHVPGDVADLQSLHLAVMDHSLGTLVPSRAAFIAHEALRAIIRAYPEIADAFWRDTLIDAAIFREWIVNVGSREAYARLAHLICELFCKLHAVGLTDGNTFDLPITQAELGDATGLSTVHVNRSLMQLRADGLITLERGRCTIRDHGRLRDAGTFDPAYLHLKPA
jgi:CRP-like cAMP-binding protein